MINKEKLLEAGIDYQEGVKRFSGQNKLYEKYLFSFHSDKMFEQLEEAMEEEDYDKAFRTAHSFKGLVANLSFVGLFRMIVPFVEALRSSFDIPHAVAMFPEVKEEYRNIIEIIESQRD